MNNRTDTHVALERVTRFAHTHVRTRLVDAAAIYARRVDALVQV